MISLETFDYHRIEKHYLRPERNVPPESMPRLNPYFDSKL